jgi:hypothetical protein
VGSLGRTFAPLHMGFFDLEGLGLPPSVALVVCLGCRFRVSYLSLKPMFISRVNRLDINV